MSRRLTRIPVATLLALTGCGGSSPTAPAPTCQAVAGSTSVLMRPGDIFRVRFTVPTGLTGDRVLFTYLGLSNGLAGGRLSHRLYDGRTLLGRQDLTDTVAVWKSSESSYGTPGDTAYGLSSDAVVVDYRSIVSGTIAGAAELSLTGGSATLASLELATVFFIAPARSGVFEIPTTITARELCR